MRLKLGKEFNRMFKQDDKDSLWLVDYDGFSKAERADKELDLSKLREDIRDGRIQQLGIDEDKGTSLYMIVAENGKVSTKKSIKLSLILKSASLEL